MRMQVYPKVREGRGYYTIHVSNDQKALVLDREAEALLQAALELAVEALSDKLEDDRHMVYPVYEPSEVDAILKDAELLEELSRRLKANMKPGFIEELGEAPKGDF